jgi:hypothetical protein
MSKEIRQMIDKVKNFKQFINESKDTWYDIDDKLALLKSYIHILNNSDGDYDLAKRYFIILHNFLIIERGFFDDVVASGKQINKFLNLEKLNNTDEVYQKFLELYDINHQVRNNVETFDNIESIRQYLSKRPEVYNKLIKK